MAGSQMQTIGGEGESLVSWLELPQSQELGQQE